jgi:hypothetical protein
MLTGLVLLININNSYRLKLRIQKINLALSRTNIRLFAEQNGKFPDSLHELNEYKKQFPVTPKEFIAGKSDPSEHSVLDGKGGLYYNSKTGELKLNLTRPLKSYWRFCLGEKRDKVPSDW